MFIHMHTNFRDENKAGKEGFQDPRVLPEQLWVPRPLSGPHRWDILCCMPGRKSQHKRAVAKVSIQHIPHLKCEVKWSEGGRMWSGGWRMIFIDSQ